LLFVVNYTNTHEKMPKENKVRGRRGAGKRKREENANEEPLGQNAKRPALDLDLSGVQFESSNPGAAGQTQAAFGGETDESGRPFYGLLSEEEAEYFRRADELLELNDFPGDEERQIFLQNVFKEAEGKELKIANSQGCSRLMERLILLSTPAQKKKIFEKFSGQFAHLIQHRFASHCCETLFIQSAPIVTQELTADEGEKPAGADEDGVWVSMENLFLYALNELDGQIGFLLTDRFASHALRVLLVVLSGKPLAKSSTKSLLASKKKENVTTPGFKQSAESEEQALGAREVPKSFRLAVDKFISDTAASLDATSIPVLTCHATANPALQLLLELELTRTTKRKDLDPSCQNSIIEKLLPDPLETEGSESSKFVNGVMYEPIGSRLLETLVVHAPGKLFKQLYRSTFKDRIGSLARNEIASYVVLKVLERVSREDLEQAAESILPQVEGLVERGRTQILKVLLERTSARNAHDSTTALVKAIAEAYGNDPATLLGKMTHTSSYATIDEAKEVLAKAHEVKLHPNTLHGSLLAQAMLAIPSGGAATLIQDSILAQNLPTLVYLGCTVATSHILQAALVPVPSPTGSGPGNLPFRKKLVSLYLSDASVIPLLATSKAGSHLLDSMWDGTSGAMMLKERIASLLADHISELKEDFVGRVVLRNWMVELFIRRNTEWISQVREGEAGALVKPVIQGAAGVAAEAANAAPSGGANVNGGKNKFAGKGGVKGKAANPDGKTALQLAREKFAAKKAGGAADGGAGGKPLQRKGNKATSANATAVGIRS
jgi:nucleolar protein 9